LWRHYADAQPKLKTEVERERAEKALTEYGISKTTMQRLMASARAGTLETNGEDYVPQHRNKPVINSRPGG
jgi:hypothetical protein